jgi:hypothetical protein
MAAKKEISLLPQAENPNSFTARFFKWLTTVGRWVIIITELIVVTAFLSRFWLDRKNSDLSEIVRQQQAIIDSTKFFQAEYTSFQKRLQTIRDYYSNQPEYHRHLDTLIKSTPNDLVYNNLAIRQDLELKKITANASILAYREDSIINFISNLMLNPDIDTVEITKIEKKAKENTYSLSIYLIFNDGSSS